jgi:hypothetical protein
MECNEWSMQTYQVLADPLAGLTDLSLKLWVAPPHWWRMGRASGCGGLSGCRRRLRGSADSDCLSGGCYSKWLSGVGNGGRRQRRRRVEVSLSVGCLKKGK